MTDLIKRADKIITHAGPATIFSIAQHARYMPLIIPRLSKFNEHVDNHQLFFINFLRKKAPKKIKRYFLTEENLSSHLYDYLSERPFNNELKWSLFQNAYTDVFIKKLKEFINSTKT